MGHRILITVRVVVPIVLAFGALVTNVFAQEELTCDPATVGEGIGIAIHETPDDAVSAVFPGSRSQLSLAARGAQGEAVYSTPNGGSISVVRQGNGRYIADQYVLCDGEWPGHSRPGEGTPQGGGG